MIALILSQDFWPRLSHQKCFNSLKLSVSVGKEWDIPLRQTQKLNAKDSEAKKSQVLDNIEVPEKKEREKKM